METSWDAFSFSDYSLVMFVYGFYLSLSLFSSFSFIEIDLLATLTANICRQTIYN